MAQVPGVPLPSVAPSSRDLPFQSADAPAGAFGANVVASLLGEGAHTAREASNLFQAHAEKVQAEDNKAAFDDAYIQFVNVANQHAVDFQANNRGMKAVAALPSAMTALDAQRQTIAGTIASPEARQAFLSQSHGVVSSTTGDLSRFASSQRQSALEATHKALTDTLIGDSVLNPQNFASNTQKLMVNAAFYADQHGLDGEAGKQFARETYGQAVGAMVLGLAGKGDITGADAFLNAHKDGMDGLGFNRLQTQLKPALMANEAASIGDAVLGVAVGHSDPRIPDFGGAPAAYFSQLAGKGVTVTSAARDAVHNAEVGGVANSNHIPGNGVAFDLVPADRNFAGLKSILMAQGLHADEMIVEKDHLHVGWKAGQSVAAVTGGPLTSFDLKAREGAVIAAARTAAEARYPGNAAFADQAVSRALAGLNQQIGAASGTETDAYNSIMDLALKNNIQDLPTLLQQPGVLAAYNRLPVGHHIAIENSLRGNANELTPERANTINTLNGLQANAVNNPDAFTNIDINSLDLPLKSRMAFLKAQQEVRAKTYKARESDNTTNRAMATPMVGMAFSSLGIQPGTDKALQFRGSLSSDIEDWAAQHDGKLPTDKEMPTLIAGVVAKFHGNLTLPTSAGIASAFRIIPPKEEAAIAAEFKAKGVNAAPADIRAIWEQRRGR